MVHTLGQRIVQNYDPSVIETPPLGSRLVLAQFRYPGGNMGGATINEGPYVVHSAERDRDDEGNRYVNRIHLYLGDARLYESEGGIKSHS
jgi:hypothetical protein